MRLLHTSDLHLGRQLCGESRNAVFSQLLDWLLALMRERAVDALVIAGDVYDSPTPSTAAQALYYKFLARLRQSGCRMAVIVGGNHDSPLLINAPRELLEHMDIHVVGRASKSPDGEVFLLRDESGRPQAAFCAVPFLRESDLRTLTRSDTIETRGERIAECAAQHYQGVVQEALRQLGDVREQAPIIATGHLFARGGAVGGGERELYVGSLGDVPASIFPAEIDYLALGHLHRAQAVAGNPARCYCGAPLALEFTEGGAPRYVNLVDFEGRQPRVEPVQVPVFDRLESVRGDEARLQERLRGLAAQGEPALIEVIHEGASPMPLLEQTVREILEGSPVKALRVRDEGRVRLVLSGEDTARDLQELSPEEVFRLRLSKTDETEESKAALMRAYGEILQQVAAPEEA